MCVDRPIVLTGELSVEITNKINLYFNFEFYITFLFACILYLSTRFDIMVKQNNLTHVHMDTLSTVLAVA